VTHRVLGVFLVGTANDFVRGADRAIHIAQQTEREVLRLGEFEVLGRCVERGTEDDSVELFESLGTVTQALALLRSTGCGCFRVPPQQHPLTPKVVKMNVPAVLVRQFEIRCNGVDRQHRQSLADEPAPVTRWRQPPTATYALRSSQPS
jgi:hypothetical protein